jgi:hypothetical protein
METTNKPEMEKILCAAIWYDDGKKYHFQPVNINSGIVVSGLRHPHCKVILMAWLYPDWQNDTLQENIKNEVNRKEVQGFITSKQRFVDRREALTIAILAQQITEAKYGNQLYSEDLY